MAPKRQGAAKILAKVKKDILKKRRNGKPLARRNATVVLAQGALAVPKKNFGTNNGQKKTLSSLVRCLDARIPRTLGLPRAVGPYTVIRTSRLHKSSAGFIMFSPFMYNNKEWFSWCGVEDVTFGNAITATNNTNPITMPLFGLAEAAEVVPAALTVQVMNPSSVQNAEGVFAMARVNQQLSMGDSPISLTWSDLAGRFLSFYSPRLLTGGKLALRGVKCDSYPLDMTEYANFMPLRQDVAVPFTWAPAITPGALAPIVFIQNNEPPQTLEFLITIEWRVRFDPGNPATASHVFHPTLADRAWNDVIRTASSAGHGVEEMAEVVAEGGALIGGAAMAM